MAQTKAQATLDEFTGLLASAKRSAVHLEMRDQYATGDPAFEAWRLGRSIDRRDRETKWRGVLANAISRGVTIRRARIVSEPVSDYIQYEYEVTAATNIAAGELVRWLPRRRASDLCLPGNDFWLFDEALVRWNHFTGDGEWAGTEGTREEAVVKLCASAFEAVWERAVPHEDYRPT